MNFSKESIKHFFKLNGLLILTIIACITALIFTFVNKFSSSDNNDNNPASNTSIEKTTAIDENGVITAGDASKITVEYSNFDTSTEYSESNATIITLNDTSTSVKGDGAAYGDNKVTISQAGTYILSGSLSDGQIYIEVSDTDKVMLVLKNADIACSSMPPILAQEADKVCICLADGTKNTITDNGSGYVEPTTEDTSSDVRNDSAIHCKTSLTINGKGSLTVNAKYQNGIFSKSNLKIMGGTIDVTSTGHAIKGKKSVVIHDGTINVSSQKDGIKTTLDTEADNGYVYIDGGKTTVSAVQDGVAGSLYLIVKDGTLDVKTTGKYSHSSSKDMMGDGMGGGRTRLSTTDTKSTTNTNNQSKSNDTYKANMPQMDGSQNGDTPPQMPNGDTNGGTPPQMPNDNSDSNNTTNSTESASDDESISTKGLKAGVDMYISGGTITINSSAHAIHSSNTITIDGGTITAASTSNGKGIAAHGIVTINDGNITVSQSYEALESKIAIYINGGEISLTSSDDGINASGNANTNSTGLFVNGGYTFINASGDGLDSNSDFIMTAGTVIVAGPTNNGNGSIDASEGTKSITGGTLIAYGSSGMAENMGDTSTQYTIKATLSATEGTLVHVEDSSGKEIITFAPVKAMACVVFSTSDITNGDYTIYTGGTYSGGTEKNGVYSDGTYSGGTKNSTITVSSIITGGSGGMGGGMGGGHSRRNNSSTTSNSSNNTTQTN